MDSQGELSTADVALLPDGRKAAQPGEMQTTQAHSWTIGAISSPEIKHRQGTGSDLAEVWISALAAARTAMLKDGFDAVAISIDGKLEAVYHSGCSAVDPALITADLVEIYQAMASVAIADRIVATK